MNAYMNLGMRVIMYSSVLTFQKKACIQKSYMVYSNSGQENTVYTVRQANENKLRKKLEKRACKVGSEMI